MTRLGAAALALLALVSVWEYFWLAGRDNPMAAPVGVPPLAEGPFDPTTSAMDPARLPWVLDPAEAWPEALRQEVQAEPCGVWTALEERYRLWVPEGATGHGADACRQGPEALRQGGWLHGASGAEGLIVEQDGERGLVLERRRGMELALERTRGLVLRKVAP